MGVGAEVAPHKVEVNAIAPAFFENNTYLTPVACRPADGRSVGGNIPAGRIGQGHEGAELALSLSLAGDANNFLAGRIIAFSGGWAT